VKLPGVAQVVRLKETASTQAVARLMAEEGAPDWSLVWADRQTHGRGRLDRRWTSGSGGLYFSLLLRPGGSPRDLVKVNLSAAQAAVQTLQACGVKARIKPPNDVIGSLGKRSGKVCGILAEASGGAHHVDWMIVGVGINVNNDVRAIPQAASLKSLTGHAWNKARVLCLFLENFKP
jgi:BirA family biotin operon repressor/biotin-[acetyl-CoA-carboxylase] ligase